MVPEKEYVESISESVVREYLSRKGLKSTLQMMDQECPRRQGSISNRQLLLKELHLEALFRKNKEVRSPLQAMLELMTQFFLQKDDLHTSDSGLHLFGAQGPKDMQKTGQPSSNGDKYLTSLARPNTAALASRRGKGDEDVKVEDDLDSETLLGDGRLGLLTRDHPNDGFPRAKGNRPLSSKAKASAIMSNMDDSSSRRLGKPQSSSSRPGLYRQTYSPPVDPTLAGDSSTALSQHPASRSFTQDLGFPQTDICASKQTPVKSSAPLKPKTSSFQDLLSAGEQKASQLSRRLSEKPEPEPDFGYSVNNSSIARDRPVPRSTSSKPTRSCVTVGDLEVGEVEDLEDEVGEVRVTPSYRGAPRRPPHRALDAKPIDTHTAQALKMLVFGSAMQRYSDEWRLQSLAFCDLPDLQYGIVQKKGGPCGVLAAVQAVFLQEMLFGEHRLPQGSRLAPSRNERSRLLALALARIFWRAGEQQRAVVALTSNQTYIMGSTKFRQDEVTEKLMLYTFTNFTDLTGFMKDSVQQFEMEGNPGVVLTMCSTVFSRGIERVSKDMDEEGGKLMGAHGYCTQELVNLLITGEAVSNVFNDSMELDSGTGDCMVLRGVSQRSDIGLLSLFEHYRSCQVGTYLKTPRFPIWVVCSESHFSVLFSTRLELISDWKAERNFDLYYYDGLARQQEQIKLTVLTTGKSFYPPVEGDLIPPLEHCIRTKWEGAEVDWNGYDPIL